MFLRDGGWAWTVVGREFIRLACIELLHEVGQVALAYKVYRCRVSEDQALPDLDADADDVAIESTVL